MLRLWLGYIESESGASVRPSRWAAEPYMCIGLKIVFILLEFLLENERARLALMSLRPSPDWVHESSIRGGQVWQYSEALSTALIQLSNATRGFESEGSSYRMPQQHAIYHEYASHPNVRTICETGFNAGVSAAVWLIANPRARVVMFDLWEHAAAPVAERWLREHIPGADERLVIYRGPSHLGLNKAAADGVRCDVLSIDGGHSRRVALSDLRGMCNLATRHNTLLIDDTNCQAEWCVNVDRAVRDFNRSINGGLSVIEAHSWHLHKKGYSKGLSVLRYPPHVTAAACMGNSTLMERKH